jgi:hypothetical protein
MRWACVYLAGRLGWQSAPVGGGTGLPHTHRSREERGWRGCPQVAYVPSAHVLVAVGGVELVDASAPAAAACSPLSGWSWDPALNGSKCAVVHNATHVIDVATGRWQMWAVNDTVAGGAPMGFPGMAWLDPEWQSWGSAFARTITVAADPWVNGVVAVGGMTSGKPPMDCGTPAYTYPVWLLRLNAAGAPTAGWQVVEVTRGAGPCLLFYQVQHPTLGAAVVSPARHELVLFSGTDVLEYFATQACFLLDLDRGVWSQPAACQPSLGPGPRVRAAAWADASTGSVYLHGGVSPAPYGDRQALFADTLVWRLDAEQYTWSLARVCVGAACGSTASPRFGAKVAWLPSSRTALLWGGMQQNVTYVAPPGVAGPTYAYTGSSSWCAVMAGGFYNASAAGLGLPTLADPDVNEITLLRFDGALPDMAAWPGGLGTGIAFACLTCVSAAAWVGGMATAGRELTLLLRRRRSRLRSAVSASEVEARLLARDADDDATGRPAHAVHSGLVVPVGAAPAGRLPARWLTEAGDAGVDVALVTSAIGLRRWGVRDAPGPDDRVTTAGAIQPHERDPVEALFRPAVAAAAAASLLSHDRRGEGAALSWSSSSSSHEGASVADVVGGGVHPPVSRLHHGLSDSTEARAPSAAGGVGESGGVPPAGILARIPRLREQVCVACGRDALRDALWALLGVHAGTQHAALLTVHAAALSQAVGAASSPSKALWGCAIGQCVLLTLHGWLVLWSWATWKPQAAAPSSPWRHVTVAGALACLVVALQVVPATALLLGGGLWNAGSGPVWVSTVAACSYGGGATMALAWLLWPAAAGVRSG